MTWPVIGQDEVEAKRGRLDDPGFLSELLPSGEGLPTTICLRFLDPYGDTVFKQLQLDQLLRELESLRPGITDRRV